MPNLIDKVLYMLSSDHVKILLDRIDIQPEAFSRVRTGEWNSKQTSWLGLVRYGAFTFWEQWAINRKCHRLDLKNTREQILAALMDGHS